MLKTSAEHTNSLFILLQGGIFDDSYLLLMIQ